MLSLSVIYGVAGLGGGESSLSKSSSLGMICTSLSLVIDSEVGKKLSETDGQQMDPDKSKSRKSDFSSLQDNIGKPIIGGWTMVLLYCPFPQTKMDS